MLAGSVKFLISPRPTSTTMMKPRISLFAEHEREVRRATIGDPLVGLTKHVDFEALAASIDGAAPRPSRAKGGRPPYPTVLMVKIPKRSATAASPHHGPASNTCSARWHKWAASWCAAWVSSVSPSPCISKRRVTT